MLKTICNTQVIKKTMLDWSYIQVKNMHVNFTIKSSSFVMKLIIERETTSKTIQTWRLK